MAEAAPDRITADGRSDGRDEPLAKRWSNDADGWVPEARPEEDVGAAYGFPGCRPVRISRNEITDYDGRFEYWDADTEIAWQVCEPTSVYHELPGQELARLTERIAAVRGAPIKSYGTGDLLIRDDQGEKHVIMQPDQILYLHPHKVRRLGHAIEVGHDELPDVVLEVDLTTDVRYRKMGRYEEWGFRELWVETPENRSPSRPNRKPGMTIRVLGPSGYEEMPESRAFPTWTVDEIHAALNEPTLSESTVVVLRRVGRALGEEGGTSPDDDPFMRVEREQSRREGIERGIERGIEQGIERGVEKGRLEMLAETLAARGIATSKRLEEHAGLIVTIPVSQLMRVVLVCRDEADFIRRVEAATTR